MEIQRNNISGDHKLLAIKGGTNSASGRSSADVSPSDVSLHVVM